MLFKEKNILQILLSSEMELSYPTEKEIWGL